MSDIDEARKVMLQIGSVYEQMWIKHQALFCALHYQLGVSLEDIHRAETWAADNAEVRAAAHEAFAPYYRLLERAIDAKVAGVLAGPLPES